MLRIENLLDPAPFVVWMFANGIDKEASGHSKQHRGPHHVNGQH